MAAPRRHPAAIVVRQASAAGEREDASRIIIIEGGS